MSVRRYEDFEAVAAQDQAELRRILREGDPAERAWAGWALAILLGREANPELADAARSSPTPGVRSLLLVILAGHGERELIEAFALDDLDDDVRAAACRYLAAITSKDDVAATTFLGDRLADDRGSPVRLEVLKLARDGRLEVASDRIERHVGDEDLDVRELAAKLLLSRTPKDEELPVGLRLRALHEPDGDLRQTISKAWIARGGAAALLDAITIDASLDHRTASELLRRIAGSRARFDWTALMPFVGRDAVTDGLVCRLLSLPLEHKALTWLMDVAGRPIDWKAATTVRESRDRAANLYAAAAQAWRRLAEVLPGLSPDSLSAADRAQLARLGDSLSGSLDQQRAMALEEDGVDLDSDIGAESELSVYYQRDLAILRVIRGLLA